MLSREGPELTQLMTRYPFTPHSKRFFDRLPIQDSFASYEVLKQAEQRLLMSIGQRGRYEPHISETIEFSSFFVAALVASQETFLGQKFAEKESEAAKKLFLKERSSEKLVIMRECFGAVLEPIQGTGASPSGYVMRVEDYLALIARFELNRIPRWKLVNQPLAMGLLHLTENAVDDLFGALSEKMIRDGVKGLKRVQFPKELASLRESIAPFLPPPKVKSTTGYLYIEELLKNPTADGRHRLTWLVLAPYLVNVKQVGDEEAIEKIRSFVAAKGEPHAIRRFIDYNVKRARRNGLMPPTLNKLRTEHPDLYALLPREITQRYGGNKPAKT